MYSQEKKNKMKLRNSGRIFCYGNFILIFKMVWKERTKSEVSIRMGNTKNHDNKSTAS